MRPQSLNFLFSQSTCLNGIGDRILSLLKRLCGTRIVDILYHSPSGIVNRPVITNAHDLITDTFVTFPFCVQEHKEIKGRKKSYHIYGNFEDKEIELVFFHYYPSSLQKSCPIGQICWISGKVEYQYGMWKVLHPDFISLKKEDIPVFQRVYPLTSGLTHKMIFKMEQSIFKSLPNLSEWIDPELLKQQQWTSWKESFYTLHLKEDTSFTEQTFEKARQRLAYDELLASQLSVLYARHQIKKQKGQQIKIQGEKKGKLLSDLPFALTQAQQRVIGEIEQDLTSGSRMVRLLQGDVGSGKTIVSLIALLDVVENGFQGVLMCPTELLARQHFNTFQKFCQPLGITVELLTGREKGKKREQILSDLKNNKINILIGTHAVFVEDVKYASLAFVVIDEQHRFGVEQRTQILAKGKQTHLLVMSATPIPRTLALSLFGDMDISFLDEKPANRVPIQTKILSLSAIPELIEKLKTKEILKNQQVYWVCPLVEESEKSDLMAVEKRFEKLQQEFGSSVGLIHGQMKKEQKDQAMELFLSGQIRILVSTTVIEVGIDVPSAGLMIIEHAERFGLSALHQLRGRIGRGGQEAICLLLHSNNLTKTAEERLKMMRQTQDGFLLAQADLKLRGSGEVLGTNQPDAFQKNPQVVELLYLFEKDKIINTLGAG